MRGGRVTKLLNDFRRGGGGSQVLRRSVEKARVTSKPGEEGAEQFPKLLIEGEIRSEKMKTGFGRQTPKLMTRL